MRKWNLPIILGVLLITVLTWSLSKPLSTSLSILLPALSGLLFYLLGFGIYWFLYPRAGLKPLLIFHFLVGIFLILSGRTETSSLSSIFLIFIPATFLNFAWLISETLIEIRKRIFVFIFGYLLSVLILVLYFYSSKSLALIYSYLLAVYLFWILRLVWNWMKPPLLLTKFWSKCLFLGQLFLFILPVAIISILYFWKGPFPFYSLTPAALLFPLALWAGIYPAKSRQMEVYLVQSEKRKGFGDLLAGLTHEINNPLNFIYSNMEPLREKLEVLKRHIPHSDDEGQKILTDLEKMSGSMEDGVQTIRGLIEQFRGFPKPHAEMKDLVDLNKILDRSIELLAHKWKEKIKIERHFGEISKVRGFASELQQVFTNLIANACDAISAGGEVEITTQSAVGGVNVFVRDSGSGIPKENITKIFDPFYTTKGQGEGTGLGLSIAQQIIKSHKGSIEVQSEEGKGTEFLVFLPS